MATTKDFIDYVCEQVRYAGNISNKKMFGEYMVYYNNKPVFLVCDNTVFVKQLPEALELFSSYDRTPEVGVPYNGAKPHYVLDVDDSDLAIDMVKLLEKILPMPKPKKKKVPSPQL